MENLGTYYGMGVTSARGTSIEADLVRNVPSHFSFCFDPMNYTRVIILTQVKVALVDAADFEYLNQWEWYAAKKRRFYAVRKTGERTLYLARELLNAKPNELVDFRDGDSLNNCRNNLRLVSRSQLAMSRDMQANNTSGFRGVSWKREARPDGKWHAVIYVNRKAIFIGDFDDIIEAAQAYDVAVVKYHGEFARPNFG